MSRTFLQKQILSLRRDARAPLWITRTVHSNLYTYPAYECVLETTREFTCDFIWFSILLLSTLMFFFFNIAKRVERASRVRRKIEFYDSSFYHKPVVCLSCWTEIQLIYITRATLTPGQFRETVIWNLEFGIVQGGPIQAAQPRCASQLSQSLLLITVHSVLAARDPLLLGRRGSETVGKPIC